MIEQRGREFLPHVMAIPVGSTVSFPNFDTVFHNVFSTSPLGAFDLGIYKQGEAREFTFTKEGIIRLGCNLHANMSAYIAVVSAPAYVVTDDHGHPLHVGRAKRLATAAMYAALVATTGGTCEHPTCTAPHHRCHAHHITWWTQGGRTDLPNLALLCPHHHRLVHHDRWTIQRTRDGTLTWTKPDGTPAHAPPYAA